MFPSGWVGTGVVAGVTTLGIGVTAWIVLRVAIGRLFGHGAGKDRPVLPSHYSSLLYHDRGHYPGYCPDCGTDNEPGYRYCEECARKLPTSADFSCDRDVGTIFGE